MKIYYRLMVAPLQTILLILCYMNTNNIAQSSSVLSQNSIALDKKHIYNLDVSNQFNNKVNDDALVNDIMSTIESQVLICNNKDQGIIETDTDSVLELDVSSSFNNNEDKINEMLSNLYSLMQHNGNNNNTIHNNRIINLHLMSRMNGMNKNSMTKIIKKY